MEWIARGNPRKRTVEINPVIIVTPEDRAEEALAEVRLFDEFWSERLGDAEAPQDVRDGVFEAWRGLTLYDDAEAFWRDSKDFVERHSRGLNIPEAKASSGLGR